MCQYFCNGDVRPNRQILIPTNISNYMYIVNSEASSHPLSCTVGNLHQSQYTEKLKSIVEFLGPKLSMEELTTIWEMQVDKNPVQV